MGNIFSTRWQGHRKKTTVEACLSLDVDHLLAALEGRLETGPEGYEFHWQDERSGFNGAVTVHSNARETPFQLRLEYQVHEGVGRLANWLAYVDLVPSKTNHQGVRYWFSCPVCRQRVRKLYLPPNDPRYACRRCHKLTYTSAQTAHTLDYASRLERHMEQIKRFSEESDARAAKRKSRL